MAASGTITGGLILIGLAGFLNAQDAATVADQNAAEAGRKLTYGGELDFNYRYIYHGIALSKGPVFQPSVYAGKNGFTLNLWGNVVLNNEAQRGQLVETDLTLTYSHSWANWKIEPSIASYFDRAPLGVIDPPTSEAIFKISRKAGPVQVFTTQTFDIVSFRNSYFGEIGINSERKLRTFTSTWSLSTGSGSPEFNRVNIGPAKGAWNVAAGTYALGIPVRNHVTFRAHVELSAIMDRQLRAAVASPTLFSGGLALDFDH